MHHDKDFDLGKKYLRYCHYDEALYYFKLSANSGNTAAYYWIGEIYDIMRLHSNAYYWYIKAIQHHDKNALGALAIFYRYGIYVKQSFRYCYMYNLRAANCGNDMAMLELHELYYFGYGMRKSTKKSLYWLRRAASIGNELAMNELAGYYLEGYGGVRKAFESALYWYLRSANSMILEDTIADLYLFGERYGKAPYIWKYNNLMEQCFLEQEFIGQHLLAIIDSDYHNPEQAIYWYKKCAEHGIRSSMQKLSFLYEYGILVSQNQTKSIFWSNKSLACKC